MMELVKGQLMHRLDVLCRKHPINFPFLMGQGVWIDSDKLGPNDNIRDVLRHGTLTIGFIGLAEDYIAGIFVRGEAQGRGIGKELLDQAKRGKRKLTLNVYAKNTGVVRFYQREGFRIAEEGVDEDTGEKEYLMCRGESNSLRKGMEQG